MEIPSVATRGLAGPSEGYHGHYSSMEKNREERSREREREGRGNEKKGSQVERPPKGLWLAAGQHKHCLQLCGHEIRTMPLFHRIFKKPPSTISKSIVGFTIHLCF